jgi:phosphoglycerate dehydrogenase-like enzyme
MKIVFHGGNAANFRAGFETMLDGTHTIANVGDALATPEERARFEAADVIIGIRLTAADPAPRGLKLYHAPAAGTDMIDLNCLPAGAALCNCFGHEDAIAEYVMAALLLRHVPIPDADASLRKGDWTYWAGRPGALRTELGGRTVGLLGFGHIGRAIATRAKAFGLRIVVANRSPVPASALVDQSFGLDRLEDFMGAADIVVTSLPLGDDTRGIVGERALAAMRPHAIIMNVGRGPVIDETALFDALSQKRIGGAIIDTWYTYPTPDKPETLPSSLPFHTLTNVVMTPHMSGWTDGTVRRRQQTMADNIARLVRGEPLENVVARK